MTWLINAADSAWLAYSGYNILQAKRVRSKTKMHPRRWISEAAPPNAVLDLEYIDLAAERLSKTDQDLEELLESWGNNPDLDVDVLAEEIGKIIAEGRAARVDWADFAKQVREEQVTLKEDKGDEDETQEGRGTKTGEDEEGEGKGESDNGAQDKEEEPLQGWFMKEPSAPPS
jgi:hypothetical protein